MPLKVTASSRKPETASGPISEDQVEEYKSVDLHIVKHQRLSLSVYFGAVCISHEWLILATC
jgi:hypothetical protein